MIYIAKELNKRLTHLTLCGQNFDGELEYIGTNEKWESAETFTSECMRCGEQTENESMVGDEIYSLCDNCHDEMH